MTTLEHVAIAAEIEVGLKSLLKYTNHLCTTLFIDDISIKVTEYPNSIAVSASLGSHPVAGVHFPEKGDNFVSEAVKSLDEIWMRSDAVRRRHIEIV